MDDFTLDADATDFGTAKHPAPEPHLVVALECARPTALSSRHRLGPGGSVILGRGPERRVRRDDDHRGMRLSIEVPDRRMSSRHAMLAGAVGRWTVQDAGSRNGVTVNGQKVTEAVLAHGDVIQLGHTFFLYQDASPLHDAPDLDAATASHVVPGLETLNAELREIFGKLGQLASGRVSILILGETGTGKEVTARALHALAGGAGPFVGVNCAAIPESLIEGELFGSARGAYSGAVGDRTGLVREANGGTLFLDEVADLPLVSQAAFLRVLQERQVRPIGSSQSHPVDIRLVSATNRELEERVRAGAFRSDLFARIAGFRFALPPLRRRREDVGILVGRLLEKLCAEPETVALSPEAGQLLLSYEFPLNIRELENWLAAATTLAGDGPIRPVHFPEPVHLDDTEPAVTTRMTTGSAEPAPSRVLSPEQVRHREEVVALMQKHQGNVSAIARETGKGRNQIQRWIKRYGIDPNDFR